MSTKSPLRAPSLSVTSRPSGFDPTIYTTKNLGSQDVIRLKQCFDIFDYDKSGNITVQELSNAIQALGLQKEAQKILQVVNSQTKDQQLDFQMFLQIFGFGNDNGNEANYQQLFSIFDKNGVGSFGVQQFTQICESVGQRFTPAEIEQMIQFADKNKDGRIDYDQFLQIVKKEYPKI